MELVENETLMVVMDQTVNYLSSTAFER